MKTLAKIINTIFFLTTYAAMAKMLYDSNIIEGFSAKSILIISLCFASSLLWFLLLHIGNLLIDDKI